LLQSAYNVHENFSASKTALIISCPDKYYETQQQVHRKSNSST